jgi:hypothetical protein
MFAKNCKSEICIQSEYCRKKFHSEEQNFENLSSLLTSNKKYKMPTFSQTSKYPADRKNAQKFSNVLL